ncbi:B12-binding domain-containing radical SAM protein [Gemmatimonadota bacterium]
MSDPPTGRPLKFLLINPTASEWRTDGGRNPSRRTRVFRFSMLSSLYVAAAMPSGVGTTILDEDIEPIDFSADADLVGLSFMTFNAPRAYAIADRFRAERGIPVIFGGYHPSFLPEEALQHADAVCIGEAECNVPRMIEDFRSGKLAGLYRNGLADLSGLPVPDRTLIRRAAYISADTVQATRGCPYRCTFCSIASFFEHTFRARPVAEVIAELGPLGRFLMFMDDNIIADRDYAMELFAAMIPLRKRWFSQCGINIARDPELLRLAHASGCRGLFIGLESLSQENLKAWRKNSNRARDYHRALERIHEQGIAVYAGMVFGNDWDAPEVFDETMQFLVEARVDALQATILTPFPGTPLYEEMKAGGRLTDADWGHYDFKHVVFEPRNMSRAQLQEGHARVLNRFYAWPLLLKRLRRQLGYLCPETMLHASIPLNLSYRTRLHTNGVLVS